MMKRGGRVVGGGSRWDSCGFRWDECAAGGCPRRGRAPTLSWTATAAWVARRSAVVCRNPGAAPDPADAHRNEGDGTWLWPATDVLDDYVEVPAPEGQPPPDAALCRKLTLTSNLVLVFLTRSSYRLELCVNGAEVCMGVPDSGDIRRSYMLTVPEASLRDGRNRRVLGRFLLPDAMLPGPQLRLVVDAVAGAGVDDEYRISVDCAPVRLSLWQDTVEGLRDLSAQLTDPSSFETDFAAELVEWEGDDAAEGD